MSYQRKNIKRIIPWLLGYDSMKLTDKNVSVVVGVGALLLLSFLTGAQASEVYFSPRDNISGKLIDRIKHEHESIKAAVFLLTDKPIAQELGKAQQRGVKVEVVVDAQTAGSNYGKVDLLHDYKVPVYVYDGGQESIMHHKFWIFGNNKYGKKVVVTGSFNPTRRANRHNHENIVVLDEQGFAGGYEQEFELLKKQSQLYQTAAEQPSFSLRPLLRLREAWDHILSWF